ncbi:aconitase X catalytic domain-containing protein [Priestia megaterium]|uniref:aconitase X catalytic domain-containing protein n=1 Tax=Priestia megaterium TaxID=1404 RepID=UPI002795C0D8|nr:aconitase X catalytic domain-containing protein [Priestia megaterium]
MTNISLSDYDKALLAGSEGKAKQTAMNIILRIAEVQGATELIDISRAHIDGCIYLGESSIQFTSKMADNGGRVVVPTTMNAISIDRNRWTEFGIAGDFAKKADRLAYEYERMGVKPTFSCTPYQLPNAPNFGEHIAWAESNAVVFANSVIGARTNRYGDFMDICAALTGRAPLSGYHLDKQRRGTVLIKLPELGEIDSTFYPVLGYLIGGRVGNGVPVIEGLTHKPTDDDLKALGAAMATSGSVGMFHIVGITPEASTVEDAFGFNPPPDVWRITNEELKETWEKLSSHSEKKVDLVLMGSPQFSLAECEKFAKLVSGEVLNPNVNVMITTNRYVYEQAQKIGAISEIERFGAKVITDSCLCMIEPFIHDYINKESCNIITNSGKFVHYGPGLIGQNGVFLESINDCARSAITGTSYVSTPLWILQ